MITKRPFGTTSDGRTATAYTIANGRGIEVTVLDYGATLQSVVLTHRGERVDVVLGYDTVEAYEQNDGYVGATVGRYAGRIPDAVLRLDSKVFPLRANEGTTHLHGGKAGFDRRVWETASLKENAVSFSLLSSDGEEGYPGTLRTSVTYTLDGDTLSIAYRGEADRETCFNPTNHAYWNLNGHGSGDARGHVLELPSDRYVPVGADGIPVAGETDVSGTRFDFRAARAIGGAYDNSFVLNDGPIRLRGERGIGMEVQTDCKAVQLYNAEYLQQRVGKGGALYRPFCAVCLETQGRQAQRGLPLAKESMLTRPALLGTRSTGFRFLYGEE